MALQLRSSGMILAVDLGLTYYLSNLVHLSVTGVADDFISKENPLSQREYDHAQCEFNVVNTTRL